MASEAEIERIVVKLIGDGSSFKRMMDDAVSQSKKATGKIENQLAGVGRALDKTGKKLSLKVTAPLTALGLAGIKAGADLEAAFTGVRKTVDATPKQLGKLKIELEELSTSGVSADIEDIFDLAAQGGRLGLDIGDIGGFTKIAAQLKSATDLGDDAGESLARLASLTGVPEKEFANLGSSIVALGNSTKTTEKAIVDTSLRFAGVGKQVGLSADEILAFSATVSEAGVRSELGGSSLLRIFSQINKAVAGGKNSQQELEKYKDSLKKVNDEIQAIEMKAFNAKFREKQKKQTMAQKRAIALEAKNLSDQKRVLQKRRSGIQSQITEVQKSSSALQEFAKIAGVSGDEFRKAFRENAGSAVVDLSKKLKALDIDEAAVALENLGLEGVGITQVMSALSERSEALEKNLATSATSFKEAAALAKEAAERSRDFWSEVTRLTNELKLLGQEIFLILRPALEDGIAKIKEWAKAYKALSPETKKLIVDIGLIAAAIGPLLIALGTAATAMSSLMAISGTLTTAMAGTTVKAKALKGAMSGLKLVVAAIVAYKIGEWIQKTADEAVNGTSAVEDLNRELQRSLDLNKELDKLKADRTERRIADILGDTTLGDAEKQLELSDAITKTREATHQYHTQIKSLQASLKEAEGFNLRKMLDEDASAAEIATKAARTLFGVQDKAITGSIKERIAQAQLQLTSSQESLGKLQEARQSIPIEVIENKSPEAKDLATRDSRLEKLMERNTEKITDAILERFEDEVLVTSAEG